MKKTWFSTRKWDEYVSLALYYKKDFKIPDKIKYRIQKSKKKKIVLMDFAVPEGPRGKMNEDVNINT